LAASITSSAAPTTSSFPHFCFQCFTNCFHFPGDMLNIPALICCLSTIFILPTAVSFNDISFSLKFCRHASSSAVYLSTCGGGVFYWKILTSLETFISWACFPGVIPCQRSKISTSVFGEQSKSKDCTILLFFVSTCSALSSTFIAKSFFLFTLLSCLMSSWFKFVSILSRQKSFGRINCFYRYIILYFMNFKLVQYDIFLCE
jgi:hypothetical protein